MKVLPNGNIAFYRQNGIVFTAAAMGWVVALSVLFFVLDTNKTVLYVLIPVFLVLMLAEAFIFIKFLCPPALTVFPQGIELKGPVSATLFWEYITAVRLGSIRPHAQHLVFETGNRTYLFSLKRISAADEEQIYRILAEHNLAVQEPSFPNR